MRYVKAIVKAMEKSTRKMEFNPVQEISDVTIFKSISACNSSCSLLNCCKVEEVVTEEVCCHPFDS